MHLCPEMVGIAPLQQVQPVEFSPSRVKENMCITVNFCVDFRKKNNEGFQSYVFYRQNISTAVTCHVSV